MMGLFNFKREIKWDKDVMKVTDSLSSIWDSIVTEMSDKMKNDQTEEVLRHFDIDMSELREFLQYKASGKENPQWIPVTEKVPDETERINRYLVATNTWIGIMPFYDGHFPRADGDPITHWMPLPKLPNYKKEV